MGLLFVASAVADERCFYLDARGEPQIVARREVPERYRRSARCEEVNHTLAAPDQISLAGTVRRENVTSALGPIELRWPRRAEELFGRTPLRAVAEAAQSVSRALSQGGLSGRVRTAGIPWKVVFLDDELPKGEVPTALISNCHPGWMTPPGNIYIVASRVAEGCGGQRTPGRVADATLAQILIHEFGHAIEFHLLGPQAPFDRARSEGFATWFESFASDFSPVIPNGSVRAERLRTGGRSFLSLGGLGGFQGSSEDYARHALVFHAVVERRGLPGIVRLYDRLQREGLSLGPGIEQEFGWEERKLLEEIRRVAETSAR